MKDHAGRIWIALLVLVALGGLFVAVRSTKASASRDDEVKVNQQLILKNQEIMMRVLDQVRENKHPPRAAMLRPTIKSIKGIK